MTEGFHSWQHNRKLEPELQIIFSKASLSFPQTQCANSRVSLSLCLFSVVQTTSSDPSTTGKRTTLLVFNTHCHRVVFIAVMLHIPEDRYIISMGCLEFGKRWEIWSPVQRDCNKNDHGIATRNFIHQSCAHLFFHNFAVERLMV